MNEASHVLERERTWAVLHHPSNFTQHSGLFPLVERLGANTFQYELTWQVVQQKSWTAGHWLRRLGNAYYGSQWNALIPWVDEWRMARSFPKRGPFLIHFLWGEFAGPRNGRWIRRRRGHLLGTFHCSARRQPSVLASHRHFEEYDWITLMSESQAAFFLEHQFPRERLSVILHGVNTGFFQPGQRTPAGASGDVLRTLMVGSTERDHEFLVRVLRGLPRDIVTMDVYTHPEYHALYRDVPGVTLRAYQEDDHLRQAYQFADLLIMPMLDCTANNAVLESMACGTPVMINRVGGVSEYVDPAGNVIMPDKTELDWVDRIVSLAQDLPALEARRPWVRRWAERFDWSQVAPHYLQLYRQLLNGMIP